MNSDHMNGQQFCRLMYKDLRNRGMSPRFISEFVGRSEQTLRRYMSEPGTAASQKPPVAVTDRLVVLVDLTTNARRDITMDEFRLMCDWTDIVNRDGVPKSMLAEIAGVCDYHLSWVGRSHPLYGIQPTSDMVDKARALEALMQVVAA